MEAARGTARVTIRTGALVRPLIWTALMALPFAVLGWTIGRFGFVLDDWFMWRAIASGHWLNLDTARPLAFLPMATCYLFSGGNMWAAGVFMLALHGISAIVFFELAARLLHSLGKSAKAVAFFIAAAFALYPSDVSTYWITASVGARITCLEIFFAALFWLAAAKQRKPLYVLGSLAIAVAGSLQAESALPVYLMLPALALVYGVDLRKRPWFGCGLAWYATMFAYLVWRFKFIKPLWPFGRFGNAAMDIRPLSIPHPYVLLDEIVRSFWLMTYGVVTATLEEHAGFLLLARTNIFLITISVFGAIALAALAYWLLGSRVKDEHPWGRRTWWIAVGSAAALTIAGMLPFLIDGGNDRHIIAIWGIDSRFSAMALVGMSALLVLLALIPLARVPFRANLAAAAGVCAIAVAFGAIRQADQAGDYVRAWSVQQQYWRAVTARDALWQQGTVVIYDFPGFVGLAPMANQSWSFKSALGLLLSPAPANLELTLDPADLRLFPTQAGEMHDWRFSGNTVSAKWFGLRRRLEFDRRALVYVHYRERGNIVETRTATDAMLLPNGPQVPLYTGINVMPPERRLSPFGVSVLGTQTQWGACTAQIVVTSANAAPRAGTLSVERSSGAVIDRRFIAAGSPAHYAFYVPCGTRASLSFGKPLGAAEPPAAKWDLKTVFTAPETSGEIKNLRYHFR